jgi:cell division protein FtsQ
MTRTTKITLIIVGAVLLAILVIVANVARSHMQVRDLEVVLDYGDMPHLVSEATVADSVMKALPDLKARQVKSVPCDRVALAASRVPFVTHVNATVSVSGRVVVRATQRKPVARLFYGNGEYLIDAEGAVLPLSRMGDCDILIAGGDFTEPLRRDSLNTQVRLLARLAAYLDSHPDYRDLIDQIYIERDCSLFLAPKLGDHIIELGDLSRLDEKFANLLAFYRRGMPRAGWNTYSKISLRFKDQVVCTRK